MESELTEIKSVIRGLLISTPKATTIASLKKDYVDEVGKPIPYAKFGYRDLVDFLKSLTDTVVIDFSSVLNSYTVVPVSSEKSAHVEKLVMKQKVSAPSRKKAPRLPLFYGGLTRRPPAVVRRPPAVVKQAPTKSVNKHITFTTKCSIQQFVSSYPEGVPVHTLMTKFLRDVVTTVDEAEMVLRDVDSLEIHKRIVYYTKKMYNGQEKSSKDSRYNQPAFRDTRTDNSYNSTNHNPVLQNGHASREAKSLRTSSPLQIVPAGYEEDDEYEDYVEANDVNNMIDGYSGGFWDVDEPCEQSTPLSRAEDHSRLTGQTANSQRGNRSVDHSASNNNNDSTLEDNSASSPGSYSNLISQRAEENIRYLLWKHPEGILSSEFESKYEEEFGTSFKHKDFGFVSIIQMAAALRHIFKFVAVSGTTDWNLFEANATVPQQSFVNGNPVIPSNIRSQVLDLVNRHPSGLECTQLEQLYEATYKSRLNPRGLGFADLESFLMELFEDLSIKYVKGKIYVHPKMPKWADILKDPPIPPKSVADEWEGLSEFYPAEALRLDYVLPHEPLPSGLKPKSLLSILVLDVISPSRWYFLKYENSTPFEDFMDDLQLFYNAEGSSLKMHPKTVLKNHLCVAEYVDPSNNARDWCRARIKDVNPDGTVKLFFIDYGSRGSAKISELKYLHQNYGGYPAQAFKGTMHGIKPPNGKKNWPDESCRLLLKLVTSKGIQAEVVEVDYQNFWVSAFLVDTNTVEDIILSNVLIEKGLAEISLYDEEKEEETNQLPEEKPEEEALMEWKHETENKESCNDVSKQYWDDVIQTGKSCSTSSEVVSEYGQEESDGQMPVIQSTTAHNSVQPPVNKTRLRHSPPSSVPPSAFTQFTQQFVPPHYSHQPFPQAQVWYNNQLPIHQSQPPVLNSNWQFVNNNWPALSVSKKPPPGFCPIDHHKQTFSMHTQGPSSQVYQINYNQPQMSHMDFAQPQVSQISFSCTPQMSQIGIVNPPQLPQMNFNPQMDPNAQMCQKLVDLFMVTQANPGLSSLIKPASISFNPWLTNPSAVYNPPPLISGKSSQSTLISELPPSPCETPRPSVPQPETISEESTNRRPESRDFSVQITTDDCDELSSKSKLNVSAKEFYADSPLASKKPSSKTESCSPLASVETFAREGNSSTTFELSDMCIAQSDTSTIFEPSDMCIAQSDSSAILELSDMCISPQKREKSDICNMYELPSLEKNTLSEVFVDSEKTRDDDASSFIYRSDDDEDYFGNDCDFGEKETDFEEVVETNCDNVLLEFPQETLSSESHVNCDNNLIDFVHEVAPENQVSYDTMLSGFSQEVGSENPVSCSRVLLDHPQIEFGVEKQTNHDMILTGLQEEIAAGNSVNGSGVLLDHPQEEFGAVKPTNHDRILTSLLQEEVAAGNSVNCGGVFLDFPQEVAATENAVSCDRVLLNQEEVAAGNPTCYERVLTDLTRDTLVPASSTVEKKSYFKIISVGNKVIHLFTVDGKEYVSTAELNAVYGLFSTLVVLLKVLTTMNIQVQFLELSRIKWKDLYVELDTCCDVAGLRKVNGKVTGKLHLTFVNDVANIFRAVSKNADSQIKEFENWRRQLET